MLRSVNGDTGTSNMARTPSHLSLAIDSRAPSILGSPRRLAHGSDKNELATIMAKLNTIASQNVAHDTIFESQKMQAEEIQLQLNEQQNQLLDLQNQLREQQNQLSVLSTLQNQMGALQKQQDRMMDLLENLKSNAAETRNHVQLESLTSPSGAPTDISNRSIITPIDDLRGKPKRGRGRPRMKCSKCKEKKPLRGDPAICDDCIQLLKNMKGKKRNLSQEGELTSTRNVSKHPRLGDSRVIESEIIDNVAQGPIQHGEMAAVSPPSEPRRKENTIGAPVRMGPPETRPQDKPEEEVIVISRLEAPKKPSVEKWTAEKQAAFGRVSSRQASLAPHNGPFFEDPESSYPPYSDIVDPLSADEMSESVVSELSTITSVAESISINELMNSSMEDRELREDSNSQNQHPSLRTSNNLAEQQDQIYSPPSPHQTANTTGHEPATQVYSIVSTMQTPKANTVVKPRKPVPNLEPDGSRHDSHHKIVQKIMGNSWMAVNRRF